MSSEQTEFEQIVTQIKDQGAFRKKMAKTQAYGFIASMRGLMRKRQGATLVESYDNDTNILTLKTEEKLCKNTIKTENS